MLSSIMTEKSDEWSPDPVIINQIKRELEEYSKSGVRSVRIAEELYPISQLYRELEEGTITGREMYRVREMLNELDK